MQLLTSRIATINRAERINRSPTAFTRRSRFTAPKALKRIAYGEVEAECTGEVGYVVVAAA